MNVDEEDVELALLHYLGGNVCGARTCGRLEARGNRNRLTEMKPIITPCNYEAADHGPTPPTLHLKQLRKKRRVSESRVSSENRAKSIHHAFAFPGLWKSVQVGQARKHRVDHMFLHSVAVHLLVFPLLILGFKHPRPRDAPIPRADHVVDNSVATAPAAPAFHRLWARQMCNAGMTNSPGWLVPANFDQ